MSNTQHTPGPWTYSRSEQYGASRFYVAQADGAPFTPHYSDVATLIAETVSDERRSIQEANARLIAAAPDLMASLQRMLAQFESAIRSEYEGTSMLAEFLAEADHARAAIAKATGGAV